MIIYLCLLCLINAQNVNYTYNTNDGYNLACQMREYYESEIDAINWLNDKVKIDLIG